MYNLRLFHIVGTVISCPPPSHYALSYGNIIWSAANADEPAYPFELRTVFHKCHKQIQDFPGRHLWPSSKPPGVIDSVFTTFIKHTCIIRVKELAICVSQRWVKGDYALVWCVGVDGEELSIWVAWVRHRSSREDLPFLSWKRIFLFTLGLVVRYRREKMKGCWGPEIRQEEESMGKFILPSWEIEKVKD